MNPKDKNIILEFKRRLTDELLAHLKRFIVFGSRARGDASEDSDLDVIVLVDQKDASIEKRAEDIAYQVMWDHDFKPIISLKVFAEDQFYQAVQKGFSFYQHVMKEGIIL